MITRIQNSTTLLSKRSVALFVSFIFTTISFAGTIVLPAGSLVDISADKALNAANSAFTRLGNIQIAESKTSDFQNTAGRSRTLILTAPEGWMFNPASGKILVNMQGDLRKLSMSVSKGTISIIFINAGSAKLDEITITGIEVKAIDGSILPCLGQIYISSSNPGTAVFPGFKSSANKTGQGGTNFGILAQVPGMATNLAFINKPDSSIVGTAFDQQPVIVTEDQFGHPTSNGLMEVQNVKVKLSSGTGALQGTAILNIGTTGGNGMVQFSGLSINEAGTKKLIATSGSFSFAITNEFRVYDEDTTTDAETEEYDPELVCKLVMSASSQIGII